jgi:DNA-binding response OmpR family regulator
MLDAWILAADPELASEAASAVAELGWTPRRAVSNGNGRPTIEDGGASRQPGIVLVIATPGEPAPTSVVEEMLEHEGLAGVPVMLALDEEHLHAGTDVCGVHELIVRPFTSAELGARIQRARSQSGGIGDDEIVRIGTLEVNLATYQVAIGERPVDFTYMEYELLKFLITNPARVFSREALLSAVWGYDYYGGARTVDVHVRRLRAKLGQEHATRIRTVRGVGYRFQR